MDSLLFMIRFNEYIELENVYLCESAVENIF